MSMIKAIYNRIYKQVKYSSREKKFIVARNDLYIRLALFIFGQEMIEKFIYKKTFFIFKKAILQYLNYYLDHKNSQKIEKGQFGAWIWSSFIVENFISRRNIDILVRFGWLCDCYDIIITIVGRAKPKFINKYKLRPFQTDKWLVEWITSNIPQ